MRRALLAGTTAAGIAVCVTAATVSAATADPVPAAGAQAVSVSAATPRTLLPSLRILKRTGNLAQGDIFTGPKFDGARPNNTPTGPFISDDQGRPVYFKNLGASYRATDVRSQFYNGHRVLTYWAGKTAANALGVGVGTDYIVGRNYKIIKEVHSHAPELADQHEFTLNNDGTATVVSYQLVRRNASRPYKYDGVHLQHGAPNQLVFDCLVQLINLKTSKVVFGWHSIYNAPLTASHIAPPRTAKGNNAPNIPWDYFHVNSAKLDTDGNVVISSRHTWAVYKVNRETHKTMWELGGRASTFKPGPAATFAWQHDVEPVGNNTYRIFDNEWNALPTSKPRMPQSRVIWVKVHPELKTPMYYLTRVIKHPNGNLIAGSQGNSQALPNGDTFINWGSADRITEFNKSGTMLFNAQFPDGMNTYRAYRSPWYPLPTGLPTLTSSGSQYDAIWNGANNVARWRILGGTSRGTLHVIGSTGWRGLDTAFKLSPAPAYVQVTAIAANGARLKKSPIIPTR